MNEDKAKARAQARRIESELDEVYIKSCDAAITQYFFALEQYETAKSVFCYCSVFPEVDTFGIMAGILADGKVLAVPKIIGDGIMEARIVRSLSELVPGKFGIMESKDGAEILAPDEIDIAIVPAAAYDADGYRLGRGGGYYDRYLAETDAIKVGLTRQSQLMEHVPHLAHDIPVDILLTEKGCGAR